MERAQASGAIPPFRVEGQGPPLVLIMGLGGTKEAWSFQIHAFRPYYRVITFDNRGMGRWQEPRPSFTIEDMMEDTVVLLDYLAIDRAHILGYSLGGIVAQEIAIRYPERVMKLILASTLALDGEAEGVTGGAQGALGLEASSARQGIENVDLKQVLPTLVELSFNRWEYRLWTRLLARLYARRTRLDGLAGQIRAAASASTLDRLSSIQAETLVLTGLGDRVIDPAASRLLASRIPRARLVMVEGGSHALAIEMRGRFNRAVLDFLREN